MNDRLDMALLGQPLFVVNGRALTADMISSKGQALLSYLAVTRRTHSRPALATLLWGDMPEERARANLRLTLNKLRPWVGNYLSVSRQELAFNFDASHSLDVADFERLLQSSVLDDSAAIALYRGDFMDDFHLLAAPDFEMWQLLERERLRQLALMALTRLVAAVQTRGDLAQAISLTRRLLAMEPWQEESHRQLMTLLAVSGQRSAALAQYEACRRLLVDELGVEPAAETEALYAQIKRGQVELPPAFNSQPGFLVETGVKPISPPRFVARRQEMGWLKRGLTQMLAGQGHIRLVLGGAGRGKTSLVQEFARQAQADTPELLVVAGQCLAYTGQGDPYLPFVEALTMLTGDVETRWSGGALDADHARRLWLAMPLTLPALIDHGPDLVENLVAQRPLGRRLLSLGPEYAGWYHQLINLGNRPATLEQNRLMAQYAAVFKAVAGQRPVLLILEDLHWIDPSSIALLFYLAQDVASSRILIVGTYRPDQLVLEWGGKAHPLLNLAGELKRRYGDIALDLGNLSPAENRRFIDDYLDTQSNDLAASFRTALFQHTGGHPLFTVELLRVMVERGDLRQDDAGRWVENGFINWLDLPARAESVIASRMARLNDDLESVLVLASVEGEIFTAEVIAQIQQVDIRLLVQRLSRELDRRHRLVAAHDLVQFNGRQLSRYRFRHHLFQHYLYQHLDGHERLHLHRAVGETLESLYGGDNEQIASQLAHHFEQAQLTKKAVNYLLVAGKRANRLQANHEAIDYFQKGLTLLQMMPDSLDRVRQELELHISLGNALMAAQGYAAPEVERAYNQARELCAQAGETPQLYPVYYGLWVFYHVRARHRAARELGESWLLLAERQSDPAPLLMAHRVLGVSWLHLGQLPAARHHLEQCLARYDPEAHHRLAFTYGQDPGVAAHVLLAWTLWLLGLSEQAEAHDRQGVALARAQAHPFSLAFALTHSALFHWLRQDRLTVERQASAAVELSARYGFPFWLAVSQMLQAWAGQNEINLMASLRYYQTTGAVLWQPALLAMLAQCGGRRLDDALAAAHSGEEQLWTVELIRRQDQQARPETKSGKLGLSTRLGYD